MSCSLNVSLRRYSQNWTWNTSLYQDTIMELLTRRPSKVANVLQITEEQINYMKDYHAKNYKQMELDIKSIKEWTKKQPHLPDNIDDNLIMKFLYINKFRLEMTKQKTDMYFSIRNYFPQLYDDRDPSKSRVMEMTKDIIVVCMPKLTPDCCRVQVIKIQSKFPEEFDLKDVFKYLLMVADVRLKYDECIDNQFVIDIGNLRLSDLSRCNIADLKAVLTVTRKAYSNRLAGVHILNAPPFAATIVNLAQNLLIEKLSNRVYCHKDYQSLHEFIPKDVLPSDYGGEDKSLREIQDDWNDALIDLTNWFRSEGNVKSNEKLRMQQLKDDEILGFQGSFRQIEVD